MGSLILEAMNPQQQQAITAPEGAVLVLAGPGSGKTRVLTHRIAFLIEKLGIPAHRIMAVTFTNKAAREMGERVSELIGELGQRVTVGTFHASCTRILRREHEFTPYSRDFVIYDSKDQVALIKKIMVDFQLELSRFQPWPILNRISAAKNELILPEQFSPSDYEGEIAQRVYVEYNQRLLDSQARDFDDLLTHTVRLFRQHPDVLERYHYYYTHLLVDEFQDTNMAQYELIQLLAGPARNLFVVGDPDQSIYAFRGADYRNVKRFQADFSPQTITLEENYRSHQFILDAATAVIRQNPDHIQRRLFSQRESGPQLVLHEAYNESDEAQYILNTINELVGRAECDRRDVAIMYRLNSQSRVLEETFLRAGMPYVLVGATHFYGRKEIRDALAFLRVLNNPQDIVNLDRIINVPARGIGKKTVEQFHAWADTFIDSTWGAMQALKRGDDTPFSGRARNVLTPFAEMVVNLRAKIDTSTPLELLDAVLDETGYINFLQQDRTPQGQDRIDNIGELRRVAHEYAALSLPEFLNEVALVSDVDTLRRRTGEKVVDAPTLLTLHAAKGLEFPVIFIVGLEEGILPHHRSLEDRDQMAEERRLMYVGLTRAKDRVHLVYTFRRVMWGYHDMNTPSRFLRDIPPEITTGGARVPQPPRENLYYQARWETDWKPQNDHSTAASAKPARPTAKSGKGKSRKVKLKPRPPATRFQKGHRVQHKIFGEGVVVNSSSDDGFELVEVLFKQHGTKKLDADFLQPFEEAN